MSTFDDSRRGCPPRVRVELLSAAKRKETLLRLLAETDWAAAGYRDRDQWLLQQFGGSTVTEALLRCQELFEKDGMP